LRITALLARFICVAGSGPADRAAVPACAVPCCGVPWCALLVQLVAVACLYLGCKVQESPKYLRDVIKSAETRKWAKWCDEHPTERRKWEDPVRSSLFCWHLMCGLVQLFPPQ
jgi:hypothetical protein